MRRFTEILFKRQKAGAACMLVSVIESTRHVPRHAGSFMLVGPEGLLNGSIGGGMLEYRCIQLAEEMLTKGEGGLRQFRLKPNEVADLGMICGGDLDVLFTRCFAHTQETQHASWIAALSKTDGKRWLALPLDGTPPRILAHRPDTFSKSQIRGRIQIGEREYYAERIGSPDHVYVFGGGHLAQELVPLLTHLGFACIVADDRPEFSEKALFPDAERVLTVDYTKLSQSGLHIQQEDYVCIMTRGHLGDTDCERFALGTPAHYIGVVGSIRKLAAVREKLLQEGYPQQALDRVSSPIGIDIHSETPAEIAVSIAAQLIDFRARFEQQI